MRSTDGAYELPVAEEGPHSEPRPKRRRVLVSLHGQKPSLEAITLGRLVAGAMQKPLHGLYTCEKPMPTIAVQKQLNLPEGALEGMVLDVAVGDPVERLVAFTEEHPTAFVIVSAEPSPSDETELGDFVTRVLESSSAPLFVVRPGSGAHLARLLVPLDGTPSTASALGPAGELARVVGASLDIVLVGEAQHVPHPEPGAMAPPQYVDQPHHEWAAFSDEFVHRFMMTLGHCPSDVPTRFFLGAGDPAAEILRYADELGSDLVVLVWHGLASSEHGATFRTVLARAACPVLVLRR
jgi:nucleotide-binding universal stress UspA family protein